MPGRQPCLLQTNTDLRTTAGATLCSTAWVDNKRALAVLSLSSHCSPSSTNQPHPSFLPHTFILCLLPPLEQSFSRNPPPRPQSVFIYPPASHSFFVPNLSLSPIFLQDPLSQTRRLDRPSPSFPQLLFSTPYLSLNLLVNFVTTTKTDTFLAHLRLLARCRALVEAASHLIPRSHTHSHNTTNL